MTDDVNEVLALYLGADATGGYQPVGQEERLKAAFPHTFQSVRTTLEKYLQLPDYPLSEWTSNDLVTETKIYEQRLARAFPELNERAINALACRWSYDWR